MRLLRGELCDPFGSDSWLGSWIRRWWWCEAVMAAEPGAKQAVVCGGGLASMVVVTSYVKVIFGRISINVGCRGGWEGERPRLQVGLEGVE
jgi:hypothetical protein